MKLLEDLKQKFPMREVAPYGFCIVVPGPDFDPDWEVELGDRGYKCFNVDVDQKRVTLVRVVKAEKGSGEKTVYFLPATAKASTSPATNLQSRVWSGDDVEMLLKRMRELPGTVEQKCVQLAKEFKGRSPAAIHQKYVKLQRRLKKQARQPKPEREDTPVHAPVTLDKLASDVRGILDVLEVQGRVLDKLFCALLMQAVEVKQEKGDLSIPPGLWIHYANALLEDDKQFRVKFRLKVEQLLEASS